MSKITEKVGPSFLLAICVLCTTGLAFGALHYLPVVFGEFTAADDVCYTCGDSCECCEDCGTEVCKCVECKCCKDCIGHEKKLVNDNKLLTETNATLVQDNEKLTARESRTRSENSSLVVQNNSYKALNLNLTRQLEKQAKESAVAVDVITSLNAEIKRLKELPVPAVPDGTLDPVDGEAKPVGETTPPE